MVKFAVKVNRDAHYEALNRTVGIALKPAIGKQIFSDNLQDAAAAGSFKGQFDTERFIFGKIREFTLRIASHGNHSQTNVPAIVSDHHVATQRDDDLPYRVIADSLLTQSIAYDVYAPKNLMILAVAHLLHDASVPHDAASDVLNRAHSSHDLLKTRVAFKVLVAGRMGLNLDSQLSQWLMMSMGSNLSDDQQVTGSDGSTTAKHQSLSSPTVEHHHQLLNQAVSLPWLGLKKEAGFGTAPIWYQQSMATGPPP